MLTEAGKAAALLFDSFKDRLTVGRTANNDIQLRAQYVSRRHAVIFRENGETRIVDWQSKEDVQRVMRSDIKRELRKLDGLMEEEIEELARSMVEIARRKAAHG